MPASPSVSLIICTHNPRPEYLRQVLDALKAQTLPKEQWELLLIDNASKQPLAPAWDLSWHPRGFHVREDEVGLTPARLRGIKEAKGDIVFVDDDNVLAPDYLANAVSIFREWPQLGAVGGSIKGVFEIPPPEWITPYLEGLVVCELDRDHWSNSGGWSMASPYGAGLCVRRHVAEDYAQKVRTHPIRKSLGRSGTGMGAGEDSDLVGCAIDLGLGTGRFRSLKMTHLIPKVRLTADYIVRLNAGFASANVVLAALRKNGKAETPVSPWRRKLRYQLDYFRARGIQRRILVAAEKAREQAKRAVAFS